MGWTSARAVARLVWVLLKKAMAGRNASLDQSAVIHITGFLGPFHPSDVFVTSLRGTSAGISYEVGLGLIGLVP